MRKTTTIIFLIFLPILLLVGFIFAIPHLLGKRVGSGFSEIEVNMCGLDRGGDASVIVGGDCRAKFQVIPDSITAKTGKKCVNIAEMVPMGGDLTTLVNSLRNNPYVLASHPTVIVSVSMTGVNDLFLNDMPSAMSMNWSVMDHIRIAFNAPSKYFPFLVKLFVPRVERELIHLWNKDNFSCSDSIYVSPSLIASRGFQSNGIKVASIFKDETAPDGLHYLVNGGNWKMFKKSLEWLSKSESKSIVLYNAPMNPKWLREYPDSEIRRSETIFSDEVSELVRHYKNIRYLDFYKNPIQEIDSSCFADRTHMNMKGAEIFSHILADSLKAQLTK